MIFDCSSGEKSMLDLSGVTTLLFDVDNTLLLFDEKDFVPKYGKLIHERFKKEVPSYEVFMKEFLTATRKMLDKNPPNTTTLEKFGISFSSKINVPDLEILNRFLDFYQTDFKQLKDIIKPAPNARDILKRLANHFELVAATNPLFPAIANDVRLGWGNIGSADIPWKEITSADKYEHAKPNIEYYEELLSRIEKTPSECIMIGNDRVNDMIEGNLGIQTYLVTSEDKTRTKVIQTDLDRNGAEFPISDSGTLEELFDKIINHVITERK